MTFGILLLTVAAQAASATAATQVRAAVPRPGLSWELSETLAGKLRAIEARRRQARPARPSRQTVQVSEAEVNSYLNLSYAQQLPKGVSDVEIRLGQERLLAKGYVDLERVRGKIQPTTSIFNPVSLLTGKVPVEISGKLIGRDGIGTVEVDTVYVASIRVPLTVLEQMVVSATKSEKMPQGFDIHAPFRLPYTLERVRLEPGKAFLEF